jgi:hypothetical protein
MQEYFRAFFDVYIQSLAIMKDRQDEGVAVNEGILFFKIEE